jgi:hypothetical protein
MSYLNRLKNLAHAGTPTTKPTKPGFAGSVAPHLANVKVLRTPSGEATQPLPGASGLSAEPIPSHLARMKFGEGASPFSACNDPSATAGVCVPEIRTPEPLHCSSSDWHERDKAYQGHHANCPACIASGKGYGTRCDTGAELWTAYSETPKPAPTRAWAAPATHTPTADINPSLLTAATDTEVQRMAERMALFACRGVVVQDAEKLTDKLLVRDREGDDRVACAECHRLVGNAPGRWRCGDRAPILSNDLAGANLGAAFVHQSLHRCRSFAEVKP